MTKPGEWTVKSNSFGAISREFTNRLGHAIEKITVDLEADAKVNADEMGARDTGNMISSIQGQMLTRLHGHVVVGAEYGRYVNDGTWKMAARPFFDNAVASAEQQFLAVVTEALKGRG